MKIASGRWVCLLLPLLSGCFPLLYAYPSLSVVPPIDAGPVPDKVYVFRVDVTDEQNGVDFPDCDRYVFREIPVSEPARIPPQAKLDVDRGWVFYGPLSYYFAHTRHFVVVRLYRPGWQTVQIRTPDEARHVVWSPAEGVDGREQAVDELLTTWETDHSGHHAQQNQEGDLCDRRLQGAKDAVERAQIAKDRMARWANLIQRGPRDHHLFRCLAPGSSRPEHRRLLLFAAEEYERIAGGIVRGSADGESFDRLTAKARWLRQRAEE